MYKQKITVAFHEMNKAAAHVAETIDGLTQDIDRDNLVILCGENHTQSSHQFFQTQLMRHLHERDMVSVLCAERKENKVLELGTKDPDVIKIISDCNLMLNMQVLSAVEWDIPVRYMDSALYDADGNKVDGSSAKAVCMRDAYMTGQIMQQNGTVLTTNGRTHVCRDPFMQTYFGRNTLSKRLLAEGKQAVLVNLFENNFFGTVMLHGSGNILNTKERKNLHGVFNVVLPYERNDFQEYLNRDDYQCYQEWSAMEIVNDVPPLKMNVLKT